MSKKPNSKVAINSLKKPKNVESGDGFYNLPPAWSFAKIDVEHDTWGVSCNSECLVRLIEVFRDFERLGTWGDVFRLTNGRKDNTRNHTIGVSDIIPRAQKRLAELKMEDVDELCSLAFGGRPRIWGIMQDSVLRVIWIDIGHTIYPV